MHYSHTFSTEQVGHCPETTLHPSILVQIPSTTSPILVRSTKLWYK